MPAPVYVIGSSNTDMVVNVQHLPKPGETVMGGTFFMNPGGKGANQAVAAARMGAHVTLVANVGNDIFGLQSIKTFAEENINTTFITTDPSLPSGVALIGVDVSGENNIIVAPGANAHLDPAKVTDALADVIDPAIVLVQLEIPLKTVERVALICRRNNLRLILNPAPAQALSIDLLDGLFLITPNETEAEVLTGIKVDDIVTAEAAARALRLRGVVNVIITLGSKGVFLMTESSIRLIPAPPMKTVDTTAAGDCFSGALAAALAENIPLDEAAALACCAASISVTRHGAQASMPSRKHVDELLAVIQMKLPEPLS